MKSIKFWRQKRSQEILYQILARACSQGIAFSSILALPAPELHALVNQSASSSKVYDQQIVKEFRAKLRLAEDLIGQLSFSLREIRDNRNETAGVSNPLPTPTVAAVIAAFTKKTT
jgi:hypothetical protein